MMRRCTKSILVMRMASCGCTTHVISKCRSFINLWETYLKITGSDGYCIMWRVRLSKVTHQPARPLMNDWPMQSYRCPISYEAPCKTRLRSTSFATCDNYGSCASCDVKKLQDQVQHLVIEGATVLLVFQPVSCEIVWHSLLVHGQCVCFWELYAPFPSCRHPLASWNAILWKWKETRSGHFPTRHHETSWIKEG